MADERVLAELLSELQRVGVDPNTFSAGLGIRAEVVIRALHDLPDGAGPAAVLSRIRQIGADRADGGKREVSP